MPKDFLKKSDDKNNFIQDDFRDSSFRYLTDNRGFKLLTNFDNSRTDFYNSVIEEAKKLNIPYVDRLEVRATAYDGKGRLLKGFSCLKLHDPNREFVDLTEFRRLFDKMSKDIDHV